MNADSEKQKQAITWFVTQFKKLELEILAHRAVFLWADQMLHIGPELEQGLVKARESPVIHTILEKKYGPVLEELLKAADEARDQAFSEWMKEWKPEGPAN
jgi:hypothetical protein